MSQARNQFNPRSTAVVIAGGGALILVAAQILAKPNSTTRAQPTTTRVVTPAPAGTTPQPPPLARSGGPGTRNLFRPVVQPKKEPQVNPGLFVAPVQPTPKPLPNATITPQPQAAPGGPAAPPAPAGPQASEIQMLGVVELGSEVKALLRRSTTGESRYFAKGEEAFGFKVDEIKEGEVTLSANGRTERVLMSTEVVIEGPGNAAVAGNSGFGGGGGNFGGGRFGGGTGGSAGGGRFGRRQGGDSNGGGSDNNPAAAIMALPTWTERLKKLEDVKAQLPADQYTRLKSFIERRAAEEKK